MMKFLFPLLFFLFLLVGPRLYFWLIVMFLIIMSLGFVGLTSGFTDYAHLSLFFSLDGLSFSLIVLSFWVTLLMYLSSEGLYSSNFFTSYFSLMVGALCLILVVTFSLSNLLMFYFFFEASLIPTLIIIMGWGYQPERLQASLYFLFYTLTASLPLLVALLFSYGRLGSMELSPQGLLLGWGSEFYMFLFLSLAFLVKMPMFFVHLWLPKAHVEAPVAGSMILAGILLKLGGYGFYRVFPLSVNGLSFYGGYIFGLSIMGMVYVGAICCRLNDLKALVAYSSVAHMALVICGVYSFSLWGFTGGLMMMVSHGLASSGLFCLVNIYYERSGSRSIFLNSGLILTLPVYSLFIFLLCAANMAAPPTLNLMSEIFLMVSIMKFDWVMLLVFPLGSYLGAVFTLYLFSFSQHGKTYLSSYSYSVHSFREFHTLFLHVLPINILVLKPEILLTVY